MMGAATKAILAGSLLFLGLSASANADPIITLLGDTGIVRTTMYGAQNQVTGSISSVPLTNPYGVPPGPTAVPLVGGNGWTLTLPIPAGGDFKSFSSNSPSGMSQEMDGNLQFYFDLNGPAQKLTFNLFEDGQLVATGNGMASINGGMVVSGLNSSKVAQEVQFGNFPTPSMSGTTFNIFDQVGNFSSPYTVYKVSVDNTLLTSALTSDTLSTGSVRKDHFKLVITTDGSAGGGVPEPASLGVLALGGMALLVRRRRA